MTRCIALTCLIIALSQAEPAHANEPLDAEPERAMHWYGWQTLLSDGLSLTAVALGATTGTEELVYVGVASLLVTPAFLHAAHLNWRASVVSLALRGGGGALLVAGFATALSNVDWNSDAENPPKDDGAGADVMIALGLIAVLSAPFVDAILGREPIDSAEARAWTVQPWVNATARGGGLTFTHRL